MTGLELYDNQPFTDLTGVPVASAIRVCPRPKCPGSLWPVPGSQHFDADGGAMVALACDRRCGMESAYFWVWATLEDTEAINERYLDDERD